VSAYSDAVLADSPVAYWRLGEPSGTTATDAAVGNDGTYVNTPTLGVAGLLTGDADTAVTFTAASTEHVTLPDLSLAETDCTFELWCKFTSATSNLWLFSEGNTASNNAFAGIHTDNSGATGKIAMSRRNDATTQATVLSTAAINDGAPHHVVGTYSGTQVELWVDGISQGTAAASGAATLNVAAIGALRRAAVSAAFGGTIDEVAVYSSVLSQARIEAHYDVGTFVATTFERSASITAAAAIASSGGVVVPTAKPGPQRLHGPLTILVTHQDGYTTRLGPDEPDAAWVPFGITWSSALPGGWKDASFNLRRRIDEDVPLRLLDEVVILDEHGQTMYEGRIHKLPRQHGDDYLLGVECVGWASHLLDDPSVPYFFVDRDMGNWQPPGLNRRVSHGSNGWEVDYRASVDGRFVQFEGPGDVAGGRTILQNSLAALQYRAPVGTTVAKLMYRGTEANTTSMTAAAVLSDDNDAMSSSASTALTLDDTLRTATIATPERYLELFARASSNHIPTAAFTRRLSKLGVYPNHGLTSVAISGEPDGFYIDDMLAWALSRGAPKLNYTTGTDGSIQRPPVVVPHASDNALGTTERIVLDLNKYVIWDWLVYENKTFYYRPTDPDRLTWEARLDQGVHLSLEGDDVERAINGVQVEYATFDGTQKVAGPVGSGFDYESALLGDTDSEGTVNAHGYSRRWIPYPVQFSLADDSYAAVIGAAYLAQTQLPSRSGDITLRGPVGHPTKGDRPPREIRAGDWIKLSDHPADVPRRIIQVSHNDDDRSTTVSVGNDLNKVDAMLEQAAVASRVALGG
jgi:hypothetical protein